MRHYIRYDSDGELVGCDTRTYGWASGADPRDAGSTDEVAQWLRKYRTESGTPFAGWVDYDCPCSRSVQTCACAHRFAPDHYFNGQVLFPKPALSIELDEATISDSRITASPGAILRLVLLAQTPEGHAVEIADYPTASARLLEQPTTVSFSSGRSAMVELTAPPQGVSGTISGRSKYVRGFALTVLGWA